MTTKQQGRRAMDQITPEQIEAMIERASDRAAAKALRAIGLHDDDAVTDVVELRSLLDTWRDARRTISRTLTGAVTIFVLGILALGAGTKFWQD